MENLPAKPLRVALYVRVSGQEQAIKGLSLEAQQEDLQEYCRERGWIVAGLYIDAAKTARKRLGKRTNFLRMLEDVKRDKVDLILFTRLDRWFRSVADYYKVMEILEAHNCNWKTTQEQYDTSTAGGCTSISNFLLPRMKPICAGKEFPWCLTVRSNTARLFLAVALLATA